VVYDWVNPTFSPKFSLASHTQEGKVGGHRAAQTNDAAHHGAKKVEKMITMSLSWVIIIGCKNRLKSVARQVFDFLVLTRT